MASFDKQRVNWDSRQKAREKHPFTSPYPDYFPSVQLGPRPRAEFSCTLILWLDLLQRLSAIFPRKAVRSLGPRGWDALGWSLPPHSPKEYLSCGHPDPSAGEIQQARDQVLYNEPMPGAWLRHETGCPGDQSCPDPGHLSD